jgi:hypothetical protein
MELATDEVLATTEDIVATDDGLEEANSSPAAATTVLSTQLEYPHAASAHMPTSRLAISSSAMESPLVASQQQQQEFAGHQQQQEFGSQQQEEFEDGSADQQQTEAVGEASEQQPDCCMPSSSNAHQHMADAAMMLAAARGDGGICSTSSSGSYGQQTTLINPAAAGMHQPLAAGSRHVLLGAGVSRLGHSPSLALALALHQQQQQLAVQQQQQYSACSSMQQQPGSPLKAGNISLASTATASPVSHSSTHYFRLDQGSDAASYAASESAPGSPMLLGGASSSCQLAAPNAGVARTSSGFPSLISLQQQYVQQQQQQFAQLQHQHSLHGPSPLSLMGTADQQQQSAPAAAAMQQQLASLAGMQTLPAAAQGDVMQLVRTMASALGGVGPAYSLLSAINSSRAAAAAAAMAGNADLQQ